jgi:hypothetical protein
VFVLGPKTNHKLESVVYYLRLPPHDNQATATDSAVEGRISRCTCASAGGSAAGKASGVSGRPAVLSSTDRGCAAHSALIQYTRLTC